MESLNRLHNTIPQEFYLDFFAAIQTTKEEFTRISNVEKLNGNLLPSADKSTSTNKIEILKDAQLVIDITFK